jgi:hypothetical protein
VWLSGGKGPPPSIQRCSIGPSRSIQRCSIGPSLLIHDLPVRLDELLDREHAHDVDPVSGLDALSPLCSTRPGLAHGALLAVMGLLEVAQLLHLLSLCLCDVKPATW